MNDQRPSTLRPVLRARRLVRSLFGSSDTPRGRRFRETAARAATLFLLAGSASADSSPVPVGAEFQVNGYTTSAQRGAAVATDADGDFVVVWQSRGSSGDDDSFDSIQGQRFSAAGLPQGAEFQVNTYTTSDQINASIATDADGGFVVVWQSYGSNGGDSFEFSVQGQRYSATGVPEGEEFQVNSSTPGRQENPSVAMNADGDFVVVWHGVTLKGPGYNFSVQGQRYSAAGVPQGTQFQVNSYTPGGQILPSVATDAAGNFVVVWQSDGSSADDSSASSIQGRRFSAVGVPEGPEFQINTYTTSFQRFPSVAMDAAGNFVVVWQSNGSFGGDNSSYSIQGRRYPAAGMPEGTEFQVNSYTTGSQHYPSVAAQADGSFVVAWHSFGSSGGDPLSSSVQAQRYSAAGEALGGQVQVNSYTTGDQRFPAVAADAGSDLVVVWQSFGSSGSDGSSESVQCRRFRLPVFVDGFESGDAGNWSAVAP